MSHADNCSCCTGLTPETPVDELNPPGQANLHYRVGTHARFLASQMAGLSAAAQLGDLTTRDSDDPTLALLDAWSSVLDVLAFYQERIANEGFLGTATERRSLLELGRAIGYELRPGVAASTYLAFTLETAPGAPPSALVDSGIKVQSVPGQNEQAQVFETLEAVHARGAWNALQVVCEQPHLPKLGYTTLYLQGQSTRLQPGDAILVVGDERSASPGNENWDFRRVLRVLTVPPREPKADPGAGYTAITLERGLGTAQPYVPPSTKNPRLFALRAKATLFGQAAADWRTMPDSLRARYLGTDKDNGASINLYPEWPDYSIAGVSGPPPLTATGTGLYGEYFVGRSFGTPVLTRLDASVNFNWGAGSPHASLPADQFCARWTGWLQIPKSGDYTFHVLVDDGVRLWLDGKLIIDSWIDHSSADLSVTVGGLQPGRTSLKLEYYENAGGARIELSWSGPGFARQIIPGERLYPSDVYDVQLDASYPKWTKGGWAVFSTPEYQELYRILDNQESGRAMFALSSKTTRLTLEGENMRERYDHRLRDAAVYGESTELAWALRPVSGWVSGHELMLASAESELEAGRWLAFSGHTFADDSRSVQARKLLSSGQPLAAVVIGKDATSATLTFEDGLQLDVTLLPVAEVARIAKSELVDPGTRLTLETDLTHSYLPYTLRINANVAPASHGDSKQMRIAPELLGSGDASAPFQRFQLRQAPLTYVSASTPSGIASTLGVRVDGVLWQEAPRITELGALDHGYLVRRADDGSAVVQFGDGALGARLPSGQLNVTATYRVGIGAAGNVGSGKLSLLLSRPLGVKDVINPVAASGGTDPEPRDKARSNTPLTVLTLDRIVSLTDFENFAAAFAGVGKAQAIWLWDGQQRLVHVTVSGVDGVEIDSKSALYLNLSKAIDAVRPKYQPMRLAPGIVLHFGLDAKLLLDPAYQASVVLPAAKAALLAAFGFTQRSFAQSLSGSELLAVLQRVPGVVRVDLDILRMSDGSKVVTRPGPDGRLQALGARFVGSQVLPAELLIVDVADVNLTEQTT